MKTGLRACGPVVAFTALAGCAMTLAVAPSDLTTGLIIYERELHGPVGPRDQRHQRSQERRSRPLHDRRVDDVERLHFIGARGARHTCTLYRDPNFRGESLELTGDIPNLQLEKGSCPHEGLNDCITAIRIGNP